jgi:hypothetical protein
MVDRASVTQAVQIGLEAAVSPGTAVPAAKTLRSVSVEVGVEGENDIFRPDGHKFPVIAVPGMEWTSAALRGKPTYSEIDVLLHCLMMDPGAPTADGTNGKKRIYTIADAARDTKRTMTVEQGDAVRAHRFAYGIVTELGWDFARNAVDLSGSMIGQLLTDAITLTATPADIPLKPIAPKQVDIFLDDTWAGLGTTKLLRVFRANPRIGNRFGPIWTLNSAATSYDGDVELAPQGEMNLGLEADAAGMALLPVFRSGATKFLRIRALGDVIAGAVPSQHLFQMDLALKIRQPQKFEDFDGVFGVGFTADIVRDDTSTKAVEITTINEIAGAL